MKNTAAIALALLTLCLAAACSASPALEPAPGSPSTGLAASLPKPDTAQQEALLAALAKINPRLANEQAVDKARSLCGRLLGQSPAEQLIAPQRRSSAPPAPRLSRTMTPSGFCR